MQPSFFAITGAVLLLASNSGPWAATVATSTVDLTGWRAYRNNQYSFELRYPPDYAVVKPRDQLQLQPPPLFRVWFKEASLVGSPIADREPPQFAVDVYDNASQRTLDAWLAGSGVNRNFARATRQAVQVGGVHGLRLTDQTLLAPNTFAFVARGPFVYRFTPLGGLSAQMFATVRFTRLGARPLRRTPDLNSGGQARIAR